jgi:hypothetical protein
VTTEGFVPFFGRTPDWAYHNATDYRNRYLIGLAKALSGR